MDITGAMSNAALGMNRASEQVSQASADIATAPGRIQQQQDFAASGTQTGTEVATETSQSVNANTSVTESLTDLQQGETLFQANGKVLETADSMLGSLIDTRA